MIRTMLLRRILLTCVLLGTSLLLGCQQEAAPDESSARPNVVLVMADDLGWGDVGFHGHERAHTPNLDRLAEDGMRFERFYAAAPVCSPTRASVLSGRHPYRYGILHANVGHLPESETNLAELLQAEGYRTGFFGKWHLGTLSKIVYESNRGGVRGTEHYSPPWVHGFDESFASEAKTPTYDPMIQRIDGGGKWWNPVQDLDSARSYQSYYWTGPGRVAVDSVDGDDSRIIMDRAAPFIRQQAQEDTPFFAVVWLHTPHLPVVAAPEDRKHYRGMDPYAKHYYGSITAMDEQIGRLRRVLREQGVAENTILWFTSDNGPEHWPDDAPGSAGPYRGAKRSLYEGGVRVPTVVAGPDSLLEPGSSTDVASVTSDIAPTIADLLDLEMPGTTTMDGMSLVPVMQGRMSERPEPIEFWHQGRLALSGNRFKLVRPEEDADFELYDLQNDPGETEDISGEHPERTTRMREALREWQHSVRSTSEKLEIEIE